MPFRAHVADLNCGILQISSKSNIQPTYNPPPNPQIGLFFCQLQSKVLSLLSPLPHSLSLCPPKITEYWIHRILDARQCKHIIYVPRFFICVCHYIDLMLKQAAVVFRYVLTVPSQIAEDDVTMYLDRSCHCAHVHKEQNPYFLDLFVSLQALPVNGTDVLLNLG